MSDQQQPQLSAHDAAMVAKMDANAASAAAAAAGTPPVAQQPEQKPQVAQRPEHVPEKFWNAEKGELNTEALLKSYSELEKGKTPPVQGEQKPPEGEQKPADQQAAEDAVKAAKLDMGALQQEFAQSGQLSENSYKALEAAGFGKEVVDSYIAGQAALAAQHDAQGFALAGGQETYSKMIEWAGTNLSAAEQSAFNASVVGSPEQMKQAILSLKAQYEGAMGKDPTLISGQRGGSNELAPFASRAEVTAAMRDSRYRTDPAYRSVVEQRIGLMDNF